MKVMTIFLVLIGSLAIHAQDLDRYEASKIVDIVRKAQGYEGVVLYLTDSRSILRDQAAEKIITRLLSPLPVPRAGKTMDEAKRKVLVEKVLNGSLPNEVVRGFNLVLDQQVTTKLLKRINSPHTVQYLLDFVQKTDNSHARLAVAKLLARRMTGYGPLWELFKMENEEVTLAVMNELRLRLKQEEVAPSFFQFLSSEDRKRLLKEFVRADLRKVTMYEISSAEWMAAAKKVASREEIATYLFELADHPRYEDTVLQMLAYIDVPSEAPKSKGLFAKFCQSLSI